MSAEYLIVISFEQVLLSYAKVGKEADRKEREAHLRLTRDQRQSDPLKLLHSCLSPESCSYRKIIPSKNPENNEDKNAIS